MEEVVSVGSKLSIKGTAAVQEKVEKDLLVQDPSEEEAAKAILAELQEEKKKKNQGIEGVDSSGDSGNQ